MLSAAGALAKFTRPGHPASYFALQLRWQRLLTPVTYWSMLPGIPKLASLAVAQIILQERTVL
ncbi:hypothetical protein [Candidatus Pantoea multigeneris]|uniref:Uncharacterized protein n=1 Tax=Candidatus Pantoea multigeneris TaxID=2608357 RepID=A0ABX0RJ18_9GAMM|nr:hypothetical protein [Pantoea multigeneris]NIF23245.1 hypothetical protein [Pantoea multigeneris]